MLERIRAIDERRFMNQLNGRWTGFFAFWLGSGLALIGLGLGTLAAVGHGRRLAAFVVLMGIVCLGIALIVLRAGRRGPE